MKVYQLYNNLKRKNYNIDFKNCKTLEDVIRKINENKNMFIYDWLLDSYTIYLDNIPKKICKHKQVTIVIDIENNNIRYFSGLLGGDK